MDEPESALAPTVASTLSHLANLNNFDPLAGHPRLRAFFECWLDTFVFNGSIEAGLRERAILRVMWRCARPFEWGNHYWLARAAGLSDEEILAVRTADPERNLADAVAQVVRAADEVVDLGYLTPETMAACRELFPDVGQLHEFLYLIAGYRMMATVSASTRHQHRGRERRGHQWPPDGIGPIPTP
ncbi:carboxymuconolactone decarboxylase family protein [Frankia sp. EAN1pec]|uniref:carboxymuconolactone decarboxylase family protein n=1 Tax=Parafrankia sp. (strain EAN1pec) TaxID=298653 RepID=UPI00030E6024